MHLLMYVQLDSFKRKKLSAWGCMPSQFKVGSAACHPDSEVVMHLLMYVQLDSFKRKKLSAWGCMPSRFKVGSVACRPARTRCCGLASWDDGRRT